MPILNPEFLLDQADRLIRAPVAGPPRDVDLRRAISSAYYALFHAVMTGIADTLVGRTHQNTPRYALAYRGVDHRALKILCIDIQKSPPPIKYRSYVSADRFGSDLKDFASAMVDLQIARHMADYDPRSRYRMIDATFNIDLARTRLAHWKRIDTDEKAIFSTMLAFPPR